MCQKCLTLFIHSQKSLWTQSSWNFCCLSVSRLHTVHINTKLFEITCILEVEWKLTLSSIGDWLQNNTFVIYYSNPQSRVALLWFIALCITPFTHHYWSPSIPCDLTPSVFFLGAARSGAEIAATSRSLGMLSASPTLALFLLPGCQRRYSPGATSTDLESVDYTCSLVAIIRRMTQYRSMEEDRGLLESSVMGLDRQGSGAFSEHEHSDIIR